MQSRVLNTAAVSLLLALVGVAVWQVQKSNSASELFQVLFEPNLKQPILKAPRALAWLSPRKGDPLRQRSLLAGPA